METGNIEAKPRPARRWLRWTMRFVLVSALLGIGRWVWMDQSVRIEFEKHVETYRAAGEPTRAADLNAPSIPDDQNAAVMLLQAAKRIQDVPLDSDTFVGSNLRLPLNEKEAAKAGELVKRCEAALRDIETASKRSRVNWPTHFKTPVLGIPLSHLAEVRQIAILEKIAAYYAFHGGKHDLALQHIERMIFIGQSIMQEPTLVSYLVGVGILEMAGSTLCDFAPDLRIGAGAANRQDVEKLLADLQDQRVLVDGIQRALRGERVMQFDCAYGIADGTMTVQGVSGPDRRGKISRFFRRQIERPTMRRAAILTSDHTTQAMNQLVSQKSWPSFNSAMPQQLPGKQDAAWKIASNLTPSLTRTGKSHYRAIAVRRLESIALATRLYTIDHDGRLPEKLEQLVPEYLSAVPMDPMAAGDIPLRWVREGEHARTYSVGEDGVDDLGEGNFTQPSVRHLDITVHLTRQPRPTETDADEEMETPARERQQ